MSLLVIGVLLGGILLALLRLINMRERSDATARAHVEALRQRSGVEVQQTITVTRGTRVESWGPRHGEQLGEVLRTMGPQEQLGWHTMVGGPSYPSVQPSRPRREIPLHFTVADAIAAAGDDEPEQRLAPVRRLRGAEPYIDWEGR